jgi:replication-associated recombination protein RarA
MDKLFKIPTAPIPVVRTEPRSIIIYASPKVGKTSICTQLPDSLIIELERGGADALNARYININDPANVIPLLQQITTDPSIKFLILDTITKLDRQN